MNLLVLGLAPVLPGWSVRVLGQCSVVSFTFPGSSSGIDGNLPLATEN
jgi:hypothetical protein